MAAIKTMTLGEFKSRLDWLWKLDDETEVTFGSGDLSFYRPKGMVYKDDGKTPTTVNIQFNEVYKVTIDPDTLE